MKLATKLGQGVSAADISLTVVAASVTVTAAIKIATASAAAAAVTTLTSTPQATLSAELGVTIEAAVSASVSSPAPSPPLSTVGGPLLVSNAGDSLNQKAGDQPTDEPTYAGYGHGEVQDYTALAFLIAGLAMLVRGRCVHNTIARPPLAWRRGLSASPALPQSHHPTGIADTA